MEAPKVHIFPENIIINTNLFVLLNIQQNGYLCALHLWHTSAFYVYEFILAAEAETIFLDLEMCDFLFVA